jgi:hypothetical protein
MSVGLSRSLVPSTTIPWVLTGKAFVPVLVVAREPSHELLSVVFCTRPDLSQEVFRVVSAQCRCEATAVMNLQVLVLLQPVREAEITHGSSMTIELFSSLGPALNRSCASNLVRMASLAELHGLFDIA